MLLLLSFSREMLHSDTAPRICSGACDHPRVLGYVTVAGLYPVSCSSVNGSFTVQLFRIGTTTKLGTFLDAGSHMARVIQAGVRECTCVRFG